MGALMTAPGEPSTSSAPRETAVPGCCSAACAEGAAALALLEGASTGNLAEVARTRLLTQALERAQVAVPASIAEYARNRAELLASDHGRVRTAGVNVPRVSVEAVTPADVVGLFVLVPGGM